jgi:uncharacterized membrane protein HdeD (DUF308 family)
MAALLASLLLSSDLGASLPSSINVLGLYWLALGVLAFVQIFVDESMPWILTLAMGILGVVAGILALNHPPLLVLILPDLALSLGVTGGTIGLLAIVAGLSGGGIAPTVLGVANLLVCLVLVDQPLLVKLEAPEVFSAILLVQGAALLILSTRTRGEKSVHRHEPHA